MLLEPEEFVDEGEDAAALRATIPPEFLARRGTQADVVAVIVQVGRALEVDAEERGQASANAGIVWSAFDSVGGESATVASSVGSSGLLLHGDVHGLPAPDASSCLPPLVVKLVSEASCVRFLSSSAIRDYYLSVTGDLAESLRDYS